MEEQITHFKWGKTIIQLFWIRQFIAREHPNWLRDWASQMSDYREHNGPRAPGGAPWNPSLCLCEASLLTGCSQSVTEHSSHTLSRPIPGKWGIPVIGNFHSSTSWGLGELSLELHCSLRHFHLNVLPSLPLSFTWSQTCITVWWLLIFSHEHFS